jgi:hypothetical protein
MEIDQTISASPQKIDGASACRPVVNHQRHTFMSSEPAVNGGCCPAAFQNGIPFITRFAVGKTSVFGNDFTTNSFKNPDE